MSAVSLTLIQSAVVSDWRVPGWCEIAMDQQISEGRYIHLMVNLVHMCTHTCTHTHTHLDTHTHKHTGLRDKVGQPVRSIMATETHSLIANTVIQMTAVYFRKLCVCVRR